MRKLFQYFEQFSSEFEKLGGYYNSGRWTEKKLLLQHFREQMQAKNMH